jgi:folate-binding protein YgfZ
VTDLPTGQSTGQSQETILVQQPRPGIIRMGGSDGLDLLNRISTNAVAHLPAGRVRPTILTNALGRIVDIITILHTHQGLILVTSPDQQQVVLDWIQAYIFFQDDVQLSDETKTWVEIGIYGQGAAGLVPELFAGAAPPEADELVEAEGSLVWRSPTPLDGFRSLLPPGALDAVTGSQLQADPGSARAAYDAMRIAAGLPAAGQELAQDVTPLDLGLDRWISFEKGCYIGQEVIARMESRQQRPRKLVRMRLTGAATPGSLIKSGGATAGTLTSVAQHPQAGWIGLGLLHTRNTPKPRSWDVDGVEASLWDGEIPPS